MTEQPTLVAGDPDGELCVRLDPGSGLPVAIVLPTGAVPLLLSATLVTEGEEVHGSPRGLGYARTVELADIKLVDDLVRRRADGSADVYTVVTSTGDWAATWEYTIRSSHPRLRIAVELTPHPGGPRTLRDLRLDLSVGLPDAAGWQLEAPGNELRPGLRLDALSEPAPVSTAGGFMGSTGLVAVHNPRVPRTVVVWPICRTEIGACTVRGGAGGLDVHLDTGVAGRLTAGESLRYEGIHMDVLDATWEQTRGLVPSWYRGIGIATPPDRPGWVETASIFEVQLGYAPFSGGHRYEPYPDLAALRADLDRIQRLGYDALQLMPRQPYPSYNVHDYADITTTYGDEDTLRELVGACHERGLRVILDVLMHGVIDQEVIARTAQRVRHSDLVARLGESTTRSQGTSPAAKSAGEISWARHILDFEPFWSASSPTRHPLVDEHPEWFMRDSGQQVIGVYTKAFDVANPSWQEYFCAAMEDLVRRLDVDGFRIDAPTYNDLPNWSTATQRRASYSPLGCLELFDRLRPRLKRIKESVMLYTEPTGVLFRQAVDVTYNYDEQWLIPAVLGTAGPNGVRNGKELVAWLRERDAVLPPGSLIAHHVDSHDTFWWPLPGEKWRREQHGLDATRALLAVFALSGGAYMTFVGGEKGLEPEVRRVHRLRAELPELSHGVADYDAVAVDHDAVYALVRRIGGHASAVLVNLSDVPVATTCLLDTGGLGVAGPITTYDVWNDSPVELRKLELDPYQVAVVTVRTDANQGER
ncbi:MAG TPA: alpha-amylase family glycosyl hydrolase [Kribbellaceae bacterium]|nr:alpha-amylase family glycosyl hydrolase [Kribbellaceae bacterium]